MFYVGMALAESRSIAPSSDPFPEPATRSSRSDYDSQNMCCMGKGKISYRKYFLDVRRNMGSNPGHSDILRKRSKPYVLHIFQVFH